MEQNRKQIPTIETQPKPQSGQLPPFNASRLVVNATSLMNSKPGPLCALPLIKVARSGWIECHEKWKTHLKTQKIDRSPDYISDNILKVEVYGILYLKKPISEISEGHLSDMMDWRNEISDDTLPYTPPRSLCRSCVAFPYSEDKLCAIP